MKLSESAKQVIVHLDPSLNLSNVDEIHLKNAASQAGVRVPWKVLRPYKIFDGNFNLQELADSVKNEGVVPAVKVKAEKEVRRQVFPEPIEQAPIIEDMQRAAKGVKIVSEDNPDGYFVPARNKGFVKFGEMSTVERVIKSGMFLPCFIFGETGLGKSLSVSQMASKHNREVIRINVNAQTNEEDLIGGFRLIDGETVFQYGPVITAMQRGAVLLIDEITSLNPAYAFCLFSALEGEPVYIKKLNKVVFPAPGFTVVATDNTKGYGSPSGQWVGVNVQNEAFLDRFPIAVEYDYPKPNDELKILAYYSEDMEVMKDLIKWANFVRITYKEGGIDATISPRRLVNIIKINKIFNNLKKSIVMSIARFEDETKESLVDFFDKIVSDPEYSGDDIFSEVVK